MQLTPRSSALRVQAAACVLAVTAGLAVVPAMVSTAAASPARPSASSSECTSAQSALTKAQKKQAAAKKAVVKAKKALAKAKKAKAHKKTKVTKAKKVLAKAKKQYAAATKAVKTRQSDERSACAAPKPGPAENAGKKLSLLGLGDGIDPGSLNLTQLTALLEQLLPGVTDSLSPDQLTSLLAGFNSGSSIDPSDALALLTGVLSPDAITSLLGGSASPEVLTGLITDIIGQLSDLGGGLPIPSDFDPTGLWDTFSGIFGTLSPGQLGSLLQLLTSAIGSGSSTFDAGQLTDLIDSLVPGISNQLDPTELTSMLAGLNGSGLSAATLASLLGGQFSPEQLQTVINGTAGQALLGSVITQVMAQLGTAGGGDLKLPGNLNAGAIASLISTVTNLLTGITGGGGGVLPVVCGLIPIPVLCP